MNRQAIQKSGRVPGRSVCTDILIWVTLSWTLAWLNVFSTRERSTSKLVVIVLKYFLPFFSFLILSCVSQVFQNGVDWNSASQPGRISCKILTGKLGWLYSWVNQSDGAKSAIFSPHWHYPLVRSYSTNICLSSWLSEKFPKGVREHKSL